MLKDIYKSQIEKMKERAEFLTEVSALYEKLTGKTLVQETDPLNGHAYLYKTNPDNGVPSFNLHPEVQEWLDKSSRVWMPVNPPLTTK